MLPSTPLYPKQPLYFRISINILYDFLHSTENIWQNSVPNINHHTARIQSTKRLTRQFSPQFCTATLLGPNFLLSALFSNTICRTFVFFPPWCFDPMPGHGIPLWDFTITLIGHTTLGRTPPDECSARRRDLYLTTHNTHKRQTSMPPVGFAPAIPASERSQPHALDCAAAGTGTAHLLGHNIS